MRARAAILALLWLRHRVAVVERRLSRFGRSIGRAIAAVEARR